MTTPPSSQPIGPGRLVLVVGPSGAGKDTVIAGTKAACADDPGIVFSRRVVTRPASETEDHDTLDDAAFDRAAKAGEFAFWWQAHGLKYGIYAPLTTISAPGALSSAMCRARSSATCGRVTPTWIPYW